MSCVWDQHRTCYLERMTDTARLLAAVETTWDAIRERHPEVPRVAVVLDRTGVRHTLHEPEGYVTGAQLPELPISVGTLEEGGAAIVGHLLHVAAHGLANVRGLKEVSQQDRRHNRTYADLGREVGLEWPVAKRPHPTYGYGDMSVSPDTMATYEPYSVALDTVVADTDLSALRPRPKGTARVRLECECGRRAWMAGSVADIAPVICGNCKAEFTQGEH